MPAAGKDSSYLYRADDGSYSIQFSEVPRSLSRHDLGKTIIGDSQGLTLAVYKVPHDDASSFLKKLEAEPSDIFGSPYEVEWINLQGYRALRRRSFPNFSLLPNSEFSRRARLFEQVFLVEGMKVFQMTANLQGNQPEELDRKSRKFWSSLQLEKK